MMQRYKILGAAVMISVLTFLAGCGSPTLKDPPPDVSATIADLTHKLANSDRAYYAGLELGRLGLTYPLPPATLEALRLASEKHDFGWYSVDYMYIGGEGVRYEAGDGAKIAFLMWQLRDLESDTERMQLLWNTYCKPQRLEAIRAFCIEQLVEFKSESVIPYLFTAAAMGTCYQKMATFHLGEDHWPASKPLLQILTKSDDGEVAEIARRSLIRQGRPFPLGEDGFGFDEKNVIPAWP